MNRRISTDFSLKPFQILALELRKNVYVILAKFLTQSKNLYKTTKSHQIISVIRKLLSTADITKTFSFQSMTSDNISLHKDWI